MAAHRRFEFVLWAALGLHWLRGSRERARGVWALFFLRSHFTSVVVAWGRAVGGSSLSNWAHGTNHERQELIQGGNIVR